MSERFTDNQDGTITDTQTGLTWTREDCWQTKEQWMSWDEAKDWTVNLSAGKFAGSHDWRLPTVKEAQTLYAPESRNQDKYGKEIHLDPVFPEGPQATIWCDDSGGNSDGFTLSFSDGEIKTLYKSKCPRMSARAVSGNMADR